MSIERTNGPVVVIGAGPAGLATAAMLRNRGVPAVVIERAEQIGASWRGHYDRLRLHTPRWLSHLPGYPIPRAEGRWVTRDGVIRYLESYVAHHGIDVRTGVEIARIDRLQDRWILRSPQGDLHTDAVVVATGYNHTPAVPEWPGRDDFRGELLHASKYRNGAAYRDRDVLVVGTGNTGAEIAVDLTEHGASRVRLAVRTPPHIVRREQFGVPAQVGGILLRHVPTRIADALVEGTRRLSMPSLRHKGLPDPSQGMFTRAARGEIPVQDVGLVDAILANRVELVAAVDAFNDTQVVLADGSVLEPDVVRRQATGEDRDDREADREVAEPAHRAEELLRVAELVEELFVLRGVVPAARGPCGHAVLLLPVAVPTGAIHPRSWHSCQAVSRQTPAGCVGSPRC